MSFIARMLGRPSVDASHSRMHSQPYMPSQMSQAHSQSSQSAISHSGMRKELLRVALRDTLNRNGIPREWLNADMLIASSPGRDTGIHLRLQVRHWDPRLMLHAPALQEKLQQRVVVLDPTAIDWLLSIAWVFSLDDTAQCPPLPHPGAWTAAPVAATDNNDMFPTPATPATQAREDLARLMAVRDEEMRRHADADPAMFAPTEAGGLYQIPDAPRR